MITNIILYLPCRDSDTNETYLEYRNVARFQQGNDPAELRFTSARGDEVRTTLPYLIVVTK